MRFRASFLAGASVVAMIAAAGSMQARADDTTDAILKRLDALEKENARLKNEIKRVEGKATKPATTNATTNATAAPVKNNADTGFVQVTIPKGAYGDIDTIAEPASYSDPSAKDYDDWYFRHKPGTALTFQTPNGEITAYGRLTVVIQDTTPGIENFACLPTVCNPANNPNNNRPVGNMGWMPAVGSPDSFVGVRGVQGLGDMPMKFIYQLETAISLSAQPGTRETNANESNVVAGALTSRNSWVGFSTDWGSFKAGKTSGPYENSTRMMNPFAGMLGTYGVIMGNTGGDNRDEFATMLDHSLWYESPAMKTRYGTFSFAALWSPGQNRATNSDNIASGESDCTGGNTPASGGFATCSDGSWGDTVSVSATYQTKIDNVGLLITGAYERHNNVNRSSDILAIYSAGLTAGPFLTPAGLPNAYSLMLYNQDIADEDAAKVGVQISLPTGTTISGIFESLHRYVPADLQFQNERQRNGTWLAISQDITPIHNISFGWAHAFHTPGDPCQHTDCTLTTVDGAGAYATNRNQADMLTAAYSWKFYPGWTWFIDYAATLNGPSAHYDLGQGGLTTDCHDASSAIGGVGAPLPAPGFSNPHCWTGGVLQGVQTGIRFNF